MFAWLIQLDEKFTCTVVNIWTFNKLLKPLFMTQSHSYVIPILYSYMSWLLVF